MEKSIFTVAILGVGARGGDTYGRVLKNFPKQFKIVSLCDLRPERLAIFGEEFGVAESERFTDENVFFTKKRADLLIIATQDADHVRHCLKAFELGYDVLMEKPITDKLEDCQTVLDAQKKYGCKSLVCHVLRYAPAFLKVAELLDSGAIGRLVAINALERVAHWHQAHSYVRGNWRNREQSTPMILAKCCHDLDLLQYYAKSKCESISSVGDLTYFNKKNAPEDSADRCVNCKHVETCQYSAKRIYLDRWDKHGKPVDNWPYNVIACAPTTKEKLTEAIKNGPYGRCVFACDNNVVDHQLTQMTFENGVKASLTMTAFTDEGGRRMHFFGTNGEIIFDEAEDTIVLKRFGGEQTTLEIKAISDNGYGHGGGDFCLINTLYDMLRGVAESCTSLEASIESHLMGIYAEESRLNGGKTIKIHA